MPSLCHGPDFVVPSRTLLASAFLLVTLGVIHCSSVLASEQEAREKPTVSQVLYLTNRLKEEGRNGSVDYSGDRGVPSYGYCEVEFTPIPFAEDIAEKVPFYLKSETNKVSMQELDDTEAFWSRLDNSRPVVLYVHGYNYGFSRNCDMAAEIQRTLHGNATVIMFSWPSNGNPSDYVSDIADMEWSVSLLAGFIDQLGTRIGRERLRILAHSLGSRGAILGLMRLSRENSAIITDQLVLIAPDFDAATFRDVFPKLKPSAGQVTLYASEHDTPLKVSRQLNGYPRLGEAGEYLTLIDGMDTIDVSATGRYQFTGHEYFYYNPVVVGDLELLLTGGMDVELRPGLTQRRNGGLPYWVFSETP